MGDIEIPKCAQFVCFNPSGISTICDELFQEVWIPRAYEFRARGIKSIILSKKADAKNNSDAYLYILKTWWDSTDAVQVAFPDGLKSSGPGGVSGLSSSFRAPIIPTQVGCFQVNSVKVADEDIDPHKYKKLENDDIKLYIMFSEHLPCKELLIKAETLCIVRGFQSYCIYELDKKYANNPGGYYSWVIEAFFQKFFKDTLLQEVSDTGEFGNCELTVQQDILEIKV